RKTGEPNRVFYAKTWLNWKKSGGLNRDVTHFRRGGICVTSPFKPPFPAGWKGLFAGAWGLEVFEELRVRIDHHHVRFGAEGCTVGFQAAVELVELRIAAKRFGVDGGGLGVALTLDLFRFAVGFRQDHGALLFGVGADLLGFGGTGGTQLV